MSSASVPGSSGERPRDDRREGRDGWEHSDPWRESSDGRSMSSSYTWRNSGGRGGQPQQQRKSGPDSVPGLTIASIGGWDRETSKEAIENDLKKIMDMLDVEYRELIRHCSVPGPHVNHAFVHFHEHCSEEDIYGVLDHISIGKILIFNFVQGGDHS